MMMAEIPNTINIAFSADDFQNEQKGCLFETLLKAHFLEKGYIVATPEPDLGDDLWLTEKEGIKVKRGQIKSSHKCRIQSNNPKGDRQYCVKIQNNNLSKWLQRQGYIYFFGMTDERFHGLAEGKVEGDGNDCLLRIDNTRIISPPKQLNYLEPRVTKKGQVIDCYFVETSGFHFGCIPCVFFENIAKEWLKIKETMKKENSLWIKVEADCSNNGVTCFKYWIGKENITRYFGQTIFGLDEAYSNLRSQVEPGNEIIPTSIVSKKFRL